MRLGIRHAAFHAAFVAMIAGSGVVSGVGILFPEVRCGHRMQSI
jgi:hypothetical protein